MSSHYFRNAETSDFFITVQQSPGFFKGILLLREQMRVNRAQDRFYYSILEKNLRKNEKELLNQILAQERPNTVEDLIYIQAGGKELHTQAMQIQIKECTNENG